MSFASIHYIIYGQSLLTMFKGVFFILTASSCLFVGIQVMFEIRASEKRKGVTLAC